MQQPFKGRLTPIQKAEQLTLLIAGPLRLFYLLLFPFIWILNGSARLLCGMFGLKPASEHDGSHSEEELRMLLSESLKNGEINPSEYKYVQYSHMNALALHFNQQVMNRDRFNHFDDRPHIRMDRHLHSFFFCHKQQIRKQMLRIDQTDHTVFVSICDWPVIVPILRKNSGCCYLRV